MALLAWALGLARRRRAAASHAALRRVWHQLRAGRSLAAKLPQAADYRAAPLCSGDPDELFARLAAMPGRRSLRSKLASGRRSATVWWSICCWRRSPTCSCGSMPTAPGRRSKRNSSPNTLIRRTASALLFLKNLAKRGRILGPLAAETGIAIAWDESLREADFRFVAEPGVRAVVIKPTLTGSLQKVQQQVAAAHALGLSVVISSSIESSLGLTQLARIAAWLTPQTIPWAGYRCR